MCGFACSGQVRIERLPRNGKAWKCVSISILSNFTDAVGNCSPAYRESEAVAVGQEGILVEVVEVSPAPEELSLTVD